MATFKVGQRVRVIGSEFVWQAGHRAIGHEGVITSDVNDHWDPAYAWAVNVPTCPVPVGSLPPTLFYFRDQDIAPLTDPRAEEFIGDMNRFASIAKQTVKALSDSDLEQVKGGSR
jgi:hypothetical protein